MFHEEAGVSRVESQESTSVSEDKMRSEGLNEIQRE